MPGEVWLFLPVLGAPLLHAPVLKFDWLRPLRRPLDGGRSWRGRRVFGDNKTWRGALVMATGVFVATLALWPIDAWHDELPAPVQDAGPLVMGMLLALGTVLAELPNSFLKRRLNIAPGTQRRSAGGWALTLVDQFDIVLGIYLACLPVWAMPIGTLAAGIVVVTAVHLVLNVAGYALGARTAPI